MRRLLIVLAAAALLRLIYLGYSDYQGDEIKALYNPEESSSLQFFLEQRKGPAQFMVTAALKTFSESYRNRALVRFPFALAGLMSVIFFYGSVRLLLNERVGFYSTIFFATNGFLIAFSRIVQYQSLVICFGLGAVYMTFKYLKSRRSVYIFGGFVCWALSILSHYDGVFFAPVILIPLLSGFLSEKDPLRKRVFLRNVLTAFSVFTFLAGLFYVPFVFNIAKNTFDYWAGRISGDVSSKISSSRYLFSVYQPIYVLHIYTILGILGLILTSFLTIYKMLPQYFGKIISPFYKTEAFRGAHSPFNLSVLLSLLFWFAVPFILLETLIYIPGTHIYTYLIPVFVLMGVAMFHGFIIAGKLGKVVAKLYECSVWILCLFLFLHSYYVFVDHNQEYPWENKPFLVWTLPKPTPTYHLSVFGFPYYRHWDEVSDFIKSDANTLYYTTNERVSISRYHISQEKDGGRAGYYVYIYNPQTFTNDINNERVKRFVDKNPPIKQFENNGTIVTSLYLIPLDFQ